MRRSVVLAMFVLGVAAPAMSQAQTIELRTEPVGEPTDALTLDVASGSSDAAQRIYLSGDTAIANVTLTGVVGRQALTYIPEGASVPAAFAIPKATPEDPKRVQVDLKVPNPVDGDTGILYAVVEGKYIRVAELKIDRPPTSGLSVDGAADNKKTLTTATDELSQRIRIVNTAPSAIKAELGIEPLTDPRGQSVPLTASVGDKTSASAQKITVPGEGGRDVLLVARNLDLEGDYTAELTLRYGKATLTTINIVVHRTRAATTVTVTDPDPRQLETSWDGDGTVRWRVRLKETSGRTVTLPPPVVTVSRKEGNGFTQADFKTVSVQPEDAGLQEAPGDTGAVLAPITVPGGGSAIAVVTITDLEGPGEFTTKVLWPGATADISATATGTLRVNWWWALGWLVIWISVASGLRYLWRDQRTKLIAKNELLTERDSISAIVASYPSLAPEYEGVVDALRRKVADSLAHKHGATAPGVLADELHERRALLERWLDIGWRLPKPPAVLLAKIRSVGCYLRGEPGAVDAAAAATDLRVLETFIEREPMLREPLEKLSNAVKAWSSATNYQDDVARVQPLVNEARALLDRGAVEDVAAKLQEAHLAFAAAAAKDLSQIPDRPPVPIKPEIWGAVVDRVRSLASSAQRASDAETAISAYREGRTLYLRTLVDGIRTEVLNAPEDAVPPGVKDEIGADLDSASEALDCGDLAVAARRQARAMTLLQEALTKPPTSPGQPGGEFDEGPDARAAAGLTSAAVAVHASTAATAMADVPAHQRLTPVSASGGQARPAHTRPNFRGDPAIRHNTAQIVIITVAMYSVAGVITAILGVILLWQPNSTWGSVPDWFAAIIWGLGIQATAITAGDTAAVVSRIGGGATTGT